MTVNIANIFLVITELSVLTNKIPCLTTQIKTVKKTKFFFPYLQQNARVCTLAHTRAQSHIITPSILGVNNNTKYTWCYYFLSSSSLKNFFFFLSYIYNRKICCNT